ncbi:MAG: RES family NAD+ phosphorylase [Candidatus Eremiobacteraeota bacterium]|nr:RES family NAD+ phosphorylase [Candidatus Eremiobacteraeota bacterium]
MLTELNERCVRLAFPLRSLVCDTLVDTAEERSALRTLANVTGATPGNPRAYIQASFMYPGPSRFSDGTFGVLYCANSAATALHESSYHLSKIYRDGNAPTMKTGRVRLALQLRGRTADIRRSVEPHISFKYYDPIDYSAAQVFGAQMREQTNSVHYDSIRNKHGGHCIGSFGPEMVLGVRVVGSTQLVWDGSHFVEEHIIGTI